MKPKKFLSNPSHPTLDRSSSLNYSLPMEFEWDPAKSDRCFREREFDFGYVVQAFQDPNRQVWPDERWSYGEERFQLLGAIAGRVFFVAFTVRGEAVRIISARKANPREVKVYENRSRED